MVPIVATRRASLAWVLGIMVLRVTLLALAVTLAVLGVRALAQLS